MHVTITEMALVMMIAIIVIFLGAAAVCGTASPSHKVDSIISQILNVGLAILIGCILAIVSIIGGSASSGLIAAFGFVGGCMLTATINASIDVARQAAMGKRKIKQRRYHRLRMIQLTVTAASIIFGAALIGLGAAGLH
jgi:hypothetical protein